MLVLVTGGRGYGNADFLNGILNRLAERADIDQLVFIQGGAKGADLLARNWCETRSIECLTFMADWNTHGRKAGFLRNREMLNFGPPDLVLAFPGGPGTADMVRQSEARGVRVLRFADGEDQHGHQGMGV